MATKRRNPGWESAEVDLLGEAVNVLSEHGTREEAAEEQDEDIGLTLCTDE